MSHSPPPFNKKLEAWTKQLMQMHVWLPLYFITLDYYDQTADAHHLTVPDSKQNC